MIDLRRAGMREERYARGIVMLAEKFPDVYSGSQMLAENRPLTRGDAPRVAMKKLIKIVLSNAQMLRSIEGAIRLLERTSAPQRVLDRLYASVLGLYMFRGVRAEYLSYAR